MIFSLAAMTGLEKCCITSAYLQWLCHSGERPVARGPLVFYESFTINVYVVDAAAEILLSLAVLVVSNHNIHFCGEIRLSLVFN